MTMCTGQCICADMAIPPTERKGKHLCLLCLFNDETQVINLHRDTPLITMSPFHAEQHRYKCVKIRSQSR